MALVNQVYDITNLIRPKQGDAIGDPAEAGRVQQLMHDIKRTVAPDTWDWVGGTGAIGNHYSAFMAKWWFIVYQDSTVQPSIQNLLNSVQ